MPSKSNGKRIYTLGEALIDFIPDETDVPLKSVRGFKRAPGGAPANVAAAVARLGGDSAFIGKLGSDAFGEFLIDTLESYGVDTGHVTTTDEANTALAFVSLKADGNRDFSFYRKPSADMLLNVSDVEHIAFDRDLLHFCSVDLIDAPVKEAHKILIQKMHGTGGIVSFDPNVRLPLWDSEKACVEAIQTFLPKADIVKVSDDELELITGISDEKEALLSLFKGRVKHVIYTKGKEGAEWWMEKKKITESKGEKVKTIDTTGAGDAFIGAMLYGIQRNWVDLDQLNAEDAQKLISFSNRAAAYSTTIHGAMASLPSLEDLA